MRLRQPSHARPLLLIWALAAGLLLTPGSRAQEAAEPPTREQPADTPGPEDTADTGEQASEAPANPAEETGEPADEAEPTPAGEAQPPTPEAGQPAAGPDAPPPGPDAPPGPGEPRPGPDAPPPDPGDRQPGQHPEDEDDQEPRTGLAGWLQRMDLFQGFTISGSNTLTFQEHAVEGSNSAYESQRWDTGSVVRQSSLRLEGPVWNRLAFQADISDSGWGQSYTRWVAGYMGDDTALLFGDLDLSIGGNEFAGFRKSTRGWQFDQRLPAGGLMRAFYIQEKGVVRNQTFLGNDTAGPYFLTYTPVIEGSEVVKVNEDSLRFGSDYRLDYDSGQLYFEPIDGQARIISASDTVSVSYQSLGYNDGGPGQIYGARAEMPLLRDKLLLGVTMLRHDRLTDGRADDTVGYQEDIYNGSGSTGPFDTNFRPIIPDGTSVVYDGERKIIDEALIVLVDGVRQMEAVDYDAYRTIGRVEFRRVVPPTALVRVQYYYEIAAAGTVAGDQDIWGVDFNWRPADNLNLSVDWARSSSGESAGAGTALSAAVDWTVGNIHTLTEYRSVDPTYTYLDTVGFQSREKGINFGLEWNFSPQISFYDRYSDLKSDRGNSFGYSGYGSGSLYGLATGAAVGTRDTGSSTLDITARRNDMGLDLRFDGWPTMRLQRSTMSNRGGYSGDSDYTNDTLTLDYSPSQANYTVRATLNNTRQENAGLGTDGAVLQGSETRQLQTSVTYRPTTSLSLAASLATNASSALEQDNRSSSRNLQLSANWMPSSSLSVQLNRSLSTSDGRVSSSYYSSSYAAALRRAGLLSSPGGGDSGGDEEEEDEEETTTRPSSEDTTDSLSVSWNPAANFSVDLSLGNRKYRSEGGQGYLSDSTQSYWNVGAMWQLSPALGLNLGLGSDTLEYLDEERGHIESQSLLVGAAYRPPGARWSANLNLNIQDGSSPTYVGYGRLQRYTTVGTHLFDVSGNISYQLSDSLTLYATAGVSDYDGGYSAFKKTSGELRMRYQLSRMMAMDLGFRSIKNIAGRTLDDVIYGGTAGGNDYVANTLSLSLSMNFQGGIGSTGTGGFGGGSVTGGPGTFGGYQPGLRTGGYTGTGIGTGYGTGIGTGFGTGSIGTGYGTGRLDTIGRQQSTVSQGPFGPTDPWGSTTTAPRRSGGGIAQGLGDFRGDDKDPGGRQPGTPPGGQVGGDVPEDWWLLNDNIRSW